MSEGSSGRRSMPGFKRRGSRGGGRGNRDDKSRGSGGFLRSRGGRGGRGGSGRGRRGGRGGFVRRHPRRGGFLGHGSQADRGSGPESGQGSGQGSGASSNNKAGSGSFSKDLDRKVVDLGHKRVAVTLCVNKSGRFVKIGEVQGSMRSRIIVAEGALSRFVGLLRDAEATAEPEAAREVPEGDSTSTRPSTTIASTEMNSGGKTIRFIVGRNRKGVYVRIVTESAHTSSVLLSVPRAVRFVLETLDAFAAAHDLRDTAAALPLPPSQQIRVAGAAGVKRFFFDAGSNDRGVFMRISEVGTGPRKSIAVPLGAWEAMASVLTSCRATIMESSPRAFPDLDVSVGPVTASSPASRDVDAPTGRGAGAGAPP